MTATAAPPGKAHPARQQAIQPYLEKLQGWCRSPAGSQALDRPAKISIGRQELVVDSWERRLLLQFFDSPGHEEELPGLLAHGVALVIKGTLDVERLKKHEANPTAEIYALQAELMLDTAIGMALLHETDLAITATVQSGSVDTAKSLTVFRHKLYRAVADAKKRIADSERRQAEALAGSMTDRPFTVEEARGSDSAAEVGTATDPELQTLIEEATAAVETVPRRRRRRRPSLGTVAGTPAPQAIHLPGRTGLLALAAGFLAVVWLGAVQLPSVIRTDLKLIDQTQIGGPADLAVLARPPSLFVTIPANQWEAMDGATQQELIDSIASAAALEGYTGAMLTTDAGRPVARWLRTRGAEALVDREEPPAPAIMTE